jgi:hypothetical protein
MSTFGEHVRGRVNTNPNPNMIDASFDNVV